jgi:probable rRNA maturation factor
MARAQSRTGSPGRLTVIVTTPDGGRVSPRGLAGWLAGAAPARARGEVTVALVSDRRMRTLNRAFRGKDYATDVLSFPIEDGGRASGGGGRAPDPPSLGDIVIATGVASRQAKEAGHSVATELRVLALHGLLHLLGYDHARDDGQMARLERKLRRAAGLQDGLIERTR